MRELILMRGLPGCGKSTFLKENLTDEQFANVISADEIRMMYAPLKTNPDGSKSISSVNDNLVWTHIRELVENRMKRGDTILLDATFYNIQNIRTWKSLCGQYRYQVNVWDFYHPESPDVDSHLSTALERNAGRGFRRVPDSVLTEKMFPVMKEQNNNFPNWIKRIPIADVQIEYSPLDFSAYKKIYVFGDIHGCWKPLKGFFDSNPMSDDCLYLFVGDYLDRGLENREVFDYLLSIRELPNVKFLEGNHERHIKDWVKGDRIVSGEFRNRTQKQIEGVDVKDVRDFLRRLGVFSYFEHHGQKYLVTHGGLCSVPDIFTPTVECVKGVGEYEDASEVEKIFEKNHPDIIQIHGHRNVDEYPFQKMNGCYRLEGRVEFGGDLRILEISGSGERCISIRNTYFNDPDSVECVLHELMHSNLIRENKMSDSISSFNFTTKAFFTGQWNKITTKARGLYIDKDTKQIVLRGFQKFFNESEVKETKPETLKQNLVFPVKVWLKENGYLGMVSVYKDEWYVASKTTSNGDYADKLREILYNDYGLDRNTELKEWVKENNVTLLFEVVDPEFDPHIIQYDTRQVILLDIVKNEIKTEYLSDKIDYVAGLIGCKPKRLWTELETYDELDQFMTRVKEQHHLYIEGFVIEDSTHFQFKYKTALYSFWKHVRSKKGNVSKINEDWKEHFGNEINWLDSHHKEIDKCRYPNGEINVIELQKKYFGEKGKQ